MAYKILTAIQLGVITCWTKDNVFIDQIVTAVASVIQVRKFEIAHTAEVPIRIWIAHAIVVRCI